MTDHPDTPDPRDPSDLDAVLAALFPLAAGEDEAGQGALPDAPRVSAHFAGAGDAALLDAAAADAGVRRLLSDVAVVTAQGDKVDPRNVDPQNVDPPNVDPQRNGHAGNGHVRAPLSDAVRARAIAAFDGDVPVDVSVENDPRADEAAREPAVAANGRGRVLRLASVWRAAAAAVLVGGTAVGVALVASRSVEAGPALSIEAIERLDGHGAIAAEGPREARLGQRFVAGGARRLSLRLKGGARVLLGAGDELRVACDGSECGRAALALDHGEALVSAPRAHARKGELPDGVRILLPDGAVLDVRGGAAHVAVSATGEPLISLREDGVAYYFPGGQASFPRTGLPQRLVGPTTNGPAAKTLFRDLEFFGGAPRRGTLDRDVSAPLWRILKGGDARSGARGALARASDAEGLPAVRFDLAPGESARLAWLPDGAALAAASLAIRVETRPGNLSPTGRPVPDAPVGSLEVSLAGVPGASAVMPASLRTDGAAAPSRVEFSLPSGWGAGGGSREVELVFSAKDAPVRAWFTGAVFRMPETVTSGGDPGGGR
jgi:hypothetical protein